MYTLALGYGAIALIGASGSGKSTLLRCIDLLEEIDDGDMLLDREAITVPGLNPVPVRRAATTRTDSRAGNSSASPSRGRC